MGLITLPMQYLPYAMIGAHRSLGSLLPLMQQVGMDLIMGGPGAAAVSVTGAVIGHLWWWVIYGEDGRGLPGLRQYGGAPPWVRALVSDGAGPSGTGVHVFPPRQQRGAPARPAGYNWGGAGNRLGTE
jgi:Derlin-2/3